MDKDNEKVTSLDGFKERQEELTKEVESVVAVEQIVTPINQWEVQLCANESNAYQPLAMFEREQEAIAFMNLAKIRLVQKATLSYEDNEREL